MKRRLFLKSTSSLLAAYGLVSPMMLLPRRSLASDGKDHYFVLIQIENGWDVTLSLDPKVHQEGHDQKDMFIEYQSSDIKLVDQLKMGPALSPLYPFASDIHIIRGIEMRRDAGHLTNREIMASGYGDGKSALLPVELAVVSQSGPLGVLIQGRITTGNRSAVLTELSSIAGGASVEDMLSLMEVGDPDSSFGSAVQGLLNVSDKMDDINAYLSELQDSDIESSDIKSLIASFQAGATYQASLNIFAQLDTHSAHEGAHLAEQTQAWNQVADIFKAFKSVAYADGESLFDRTTFMVVSEFARTSALNSSAGKDHNPHANAVLLAGRGVNGGQSSGESFVIGVNESRYGVAEHISRAIDYQTGEIVTSALANSKGVHLIFPENVSATIGQIFGSPKGFYSHHGGTAKVIPGVIKS